MRSINKVRHGLSILALAVSAQSALAADGWQINSQGSGASGASAVSKLNVGGIGFVQMAQDANVPALYTFIEHGAYQAFSPGGFSPFAGNEITVTYSVSGSGNSNDPGALKLTSGQINIFSDSNRDFASMAPNYGADNGTRIASFDISYGYVADSNGRIVVNATGVAGSFAAGYLFNSAGTDLATLPNVQLQLALFNQPIMPDGPMIAGVVCGIAQACRTGGVTLSPQAFTVQDMGEVSISAVPEPESAAMFLAGLGLLAGVARRRRG